MATKKNHEEEAPKGLPLFMGTSNVYVGFAGRDGGVIGISLAYERDNHNPNKQLWVRFAAIFKTADMLNSASFPGLQSRGGNQFRLNGVKTHGVHLDKVAFKVFEQPVSELAFPTVVRKTQVVEQVAAWAIKVLAANGYSIKASQGQLASTLLEVCFPVATDLSVPEVILELPENSIKPYKQPSINDEAAADGIKIKTQPVLEDDEEGEEEEDEN